MSKCVNLFCQAKILGEDFPFEIKDKEGTNRITLTRTCKSEQIEVEVLLPSPVEENQAEDGEKLSQSHAGSDVVSSQYYCIPLVVRIHKGAAASCLEISCRSCPTELVIESLEFRSSGASGGSLSGGTAFRLVFCTCAVATC
jgi:complement component 1 Q subcomponent-binding protein